MKKRILIGVFCFALSLSGCALFPLREGEEPLVRSEKSNVTTEIAIKVTELPTEEEEDKPSEQIVKPAEIDESEETKDLIYCISAVNVRESGGNTSRVIGSLRTGDAATKISQEGGWIEIMFEGLHGYVYMDYMSETPPN